MNGIEAFFDTNVLIYLATPDPEKAGRTEALVRRGGVISIQVLDEFASVASRKYKAPWPQIHAVLTALKDALEVRPVTLETHELGLRVAERYRFSVYDSMLIAAALLAGCRTFYSEDMHDGQVIEGRLTIRNPFA